MLYLMATLRGGGTLVSSFKDVKNVQKYASRVFAKQASFNVWRTVGTTHPVSGEATLMRQRRMVNGELIVSLEEVTPKAGFEQSHEYNPDNFEPAAIPAQATGTISRYGQLRPRKLGLWTAPEGENAVPGAVPGVRYPIHAHDGTGQRYVILHVATGDTPEVTYPLDPAFTPVSASYGENDGGAYDGDDDDSSESGDDSF